jgi:hypothetical protein
MLLLLGFLFLLTSGNGWRNLTAVSAIAFCKLNSFNLMSMKLSASTARIETKLCAILPPMSTEILGQVYREYWCFLHRQAGDRSASDCNLD